MTTIDIAFFPHIFDLIYQAADFQALLRLRLTCRALRDRIDDDWGYLRVHLSYEEPPEIVNRRGVVVPHDSASLRLTFALDILGTGSGDVFELSNHLQPEVVRILKFNFVALTSRAKTIILADEDVGNDSSNCLDPPFPEHQPVNLVYQLDCSLSEVSICRSRPAFYEIGNVRWSADIYVVLSGCDPVDGCADDLIDNAINFLAGEESNVFDNPPPTHRVNFYFVDIRSWFDLSLTDLPDDDPRRLDQTLTGADTFYAYLLRKLGYSNKMEGEDDEWEYDHYWPCQAVLNRVFQQVQCISSDQMRKRIGDKAYDIVFAPRDMCGAASSSTSSTSEDNYSD